MALAKLEAALSGKKLDDLQDLPKNVPASERLEPDVSMIVDVIDALREGKSYREIQLTVQKNKKMLTIGQIKEINDARLAKVAELLAEEEPETP